MFIRDYGRVGMVGRGVRSPKSRRQGQLQPFRPLLVSWSGRGELVTLTSVEPNGAPARIAGRWLVSGFYLNELLLRLLMRYDPHPGLYAIYEATLQDLGQLGQISNVHQQELQHERILRLFEKSLLEELGYGLLLDHDVDTGEPIDVKQNYLYRFETGPVRRVDKHDFSGVPISGAGLVSLFRNDLSDKASLREAKRLMRAILAQYLGDKPLFSRELLRIKE
jgi:DNA repair protein RecO (recombination protein O)